MNYKPYLEEKTIDNEYKNYNFIFSPVLNNKGSVRVLDDSRLEDKTFRLVVDDKELGYRVQTEFPSVIADLIDLAVAIHTSDRLAPYNLGGRQRCLNVSIPVRHQELLNAEPFRTKLEELLEWATGSKWIFDFQRRTAPGRFVENPCLPIAPQGCEVVLWSGGLDALAGLYTRLKTYPKQSFVLFGTGSNKIAYARQEKVAKEVQSIFPGRCNLFRVPISVQDSCRQNKNKLSRGRGVAFILLGAACAYLMGQRVLCVYENGIGAINLPYRGSAIGLDHTRSINPLTLLRISEVLSQLLREEFRVTNPFIFCTKAQMCKALAEDNRKKLVSLTMSCDSPHRQIPVQCGYCSSCLLRRQALVAANIDDKTSYVVLHGQRQVKEPSLYFLNIREQVRILRSLLTVSDEQSIQWENLTQRFPELDDIVDRTAATEELLPSYMQDCLIQLYKTHISEWDAVESRIAVGLLNKKNNQQTLDKFLVKAEQS